MTLDEIRRAKGTLVKSIVGLVDDFEDSVNVKVKSILQYPNCEIRLNPWARKIRKRRGEKGMDLEEIKRAKEVLLEDVLVLAGNFIRRTSVKIVDICLYDEIIKMSHVRYCQVTLDLGV